MTRKGFFNQILCAAAKEIDCAEEMLCAEAQHLGSLPLRQFGVPRSDFMIWGARRASS
jgi:hypothetical protein